MIVMAFAAVPASAGTQVVTGEDEHCAGDAGEPICDFTRKLIDYARGGAPDPSKPLLAIDCDDIEYINDAYDADPAVTVVCPGSPAYDSTVFSTDSFSAIMVGEGEAQNGVLNPRTNDFAAFFNQGGGIATWNSADGLDSNLDFLPLDASLDEEDSPDQPYVVTAAGSAALGITDAEINDNPARHEIYFDPPAGNPLQVGARDDDDEAMVLFARVDRRAPTSSSGGCVSATEVGLTVSDPNGSGPASVRYTVDGGSEQSTNTDASGNARVAVADGQHTIVFRGVDAAGNVEANPNSVTVTCAAALRRDRTRPRASISGLPRGCVSRAFRIRVRLRDGSGIARTTVHRDSRRLVNRRFRRTTRVSFTVRISVAGLRAGRHVIRVGVRDGAGNRRIIRQRFRVCAAPNFTG